MARCIGEEFVRWNPPSGGDETLGLVQFAMFPLLDNEALPENTTADAERWAAGMAAPVSAVDDQTTIKVADGACEVVLKGNWMLFNPQHGLRHESAGDGCPWWSALGSSRVRGTNANESANRA